MSLSDEASQQATLAKLAQSRADIRRVLEPPLRSSQGSETGSAAHAAGNHAAEVFPRSRTMRSWLAGS